MEQGKEKLIVQQQAEIIKMMQIKNEEQKVIIEKLVRENKELMKAIICCTCCSNKYCSGSKEQVKSCAICTKNACVSCSSECQGCNKKICKACKTKCNNCDKEICKTCKTKCNNCNKETCKVCKLECNSCKKEWCKKCSIECPMCKKAFCLLCISYCQNCHVQICFNDSKSMNHCSVLHMLGSDSVYLYDTVSKKSKIIKCIEPKINYAIGTVRICNRIYYCGGDINDGKESLSRTEYLIYKDNLDEYEKVLLADMKIPKRGNTLTAINHNSIMSIGGFTNGDNISECEIYDIAWNERKQICSLNCARNSAGACNYNQKMIYVFGSLNECKSPIECIDISKVEYSKWEITKYNNLENWNYKGDGSSIQLGNDQIMLLSPEGYSYIYTISNQTITSKKEMQAKDRFGQT